MITVQANPKDLDRILRKLQGLGKEAPKAIRTAVNDTAVSARKLLAQQAQQQYTVKSGGFNKHAKIKKATLSKLAATISVHGKPLTQPRYHTTAPKSGVKTEVLKGGGLKELVNSAGNKAFKAKVATGSKNVKGTADKQDKTTAMILQRVGKARYPMRSFHGPSVAKMIEKVYSGGQVTDEGLKAEIARLYQENLQKQIDKAVRG